MSRWGGLRRTTVERLTDKGVLKFDFQKGRRQHCCFWQ